MRIVGLLALAILFPVTAYAALVNINTANATLLDMLPGIGPSKATAIVDYRTKNGSFAVIEDIQKVSGIGPVTFANLKEFITVGIPESTLSQLQPSTPVASYEKVQTVEPIINKKTVVQPHEEAVLAPTTTVEPAAVGAVSPVSPASSKNIRATGLFHSPWTFGLLGVIVVAGGAFIFL